MMSVHVRPQGHDRHAIVFGPPSDPGTGTNAIVIREALDGLLSKTVSVDPGLREG
jgi:hypothetical protein